MLNYITLFKGIIVLDFLLGRLITITSSCFGIANLISLIRSLCMIKTIVITLTSLMLISWAIMKNITLSIILSSHSKLYMLLLLIYIRAILYYFQIGLLVLLIAIWRRSRVLDWLGREMWFKSNFLSFHLKVLLKVNVVHLNWWIILQKIVNFKMECRIIQQS